MGDSGLFARIQQRKFCSHRLSEIGTSLQEMPHRRAVWRRYEEIRGNIHQRTQHERTLCHVGVWNNQPVTAKGGRAEYKNIEVERSW
jgi:hypothetical protein